MAWIVATVVDMHITVASPRPVRTSRVVGLSKLKPTQTRITVGITQCPGGCGWTLQYSCPGQPRGSKGPAGDDGTDGHRCCCGAAQGWRAVARPQPTGDIATTLKQIEITEDVETVPADLLVTAAEKAHMNRTVAATQIESPGPAGARQALCMGRGKIVMIDTSFNSFDRYTDGRGYLGGEGYWAASLQYILETLGYDVEVAWPWPGDRLVEDLRAGDVDRVIFNGGRRPGHEIFSVPEIACRARALHWWGDIAPSRGRGSPSPGWGSQNILVPFKPRRGVEDHNCK